MTNTNTNPVVNEAKESVEPKKKNVFSRILAAIFAAACVGVLFLPFIYVVSLDNGAEKMSVFNALQRLFSEQTTTKIFGFLPTFMGNASDGGVIATFAFYLLLLALVCSFIFGVITIFCSKKAPAMLRMSSFFFALGFGLYALCTLSYTHLHAEALVFDILFLSLMGVGAIVYCVLSIIKSGKTAVMNIVMFCLSLLAIAALILTAKDDDFALENGFYKLGLGNTLYMGTALYENVKVAIFFVLVAFIVIAAIRIMMKKGRWMDVACSAFMLAVAVVMVFFQIISIDGREAIQPLKELYPTDAGYAAVDTTVKYLVLTLVATAILLIQFFISVSRLRARKVNAVASENAPVAEAAVASEESTTVAASEETPVEEEVVEAVAYDGGPVGGVEMAEEVPPATDAKAAEYDYDFYNSKSFDPFLATLSKQECSEFYDLFILKCKGTVGSVPEYEVGGDNKVFFKKAFIYIGQYRDKISSGLLGKMYDFNSKLS